MSVEEDARDVARVRSGDGAAFAGLVGRWQRPLVNLAFRFCRDPEIAEEMAQEAFLKAYRALGRWRGDGAFSTWLFSVALNSYRSALRRRRPVEVSLDAVAGLAAQGGAAERMEEGERRRLLRRAVAALSPKYRDALLLFYFHDLDLRQAAATLGLSEGTLKSHLHRAKKLLRTRLGVLLHGAAGEEESAWTRSTDCSLTTKS